MQTIQIESENPVSVIELTLSPERPNYALFEAAGKRYRLSFMQTMNGAVYLQFTSSCRVVACYLIEGVCELIPSALMPALGRQYIVAAVTDDTVRLVAAPPQTVTIADVPNLDGDVMNIAMVGP